MRFRSVTSTATALVASLSLSLAALTAAPPSAHADEDPATRVPLVPTPAPEGTRADAPAMTRTYYGWQNLGVDAASIALFFASIDSGDDPAAATVAYGSVALMFFGSPTVHALHGNLGRAGQSLALRFGLPLVLGGITYAVMPKEDCSGSHDDGWCGAGEIIIPGYVGILGLGLAMLVDDVGLAYDEKPAAPSWTPTFNASKGGMTFGLAGTF
jgi:hypothetical protein